jgi:SAM-dependent methyltransferase
MIDSATRCVLASDEALRYLRFLRGAFAAQERTGCVDACLSQVAGDIMEHARSLGWLEKVAGRWQLTPIGYKLSNIAKEYCNWLDQGRPLLDGATLELVAGKRVLDVGCGSGRLLLGIQRCGGQAVGVDLEEFFLESLPILAALEGVAVPRGVRARAEHLPFPDHCFDVVFCRLVLTYVLDVRGCLREFARVLVPGGRLILDYPTMSSGLRTLWKGGWRGNWRHVGWQAFGILNSISMELTGRQWVLAVKGRMHEKHSPTYPTAAWVRRALAHAGFMLLPLGDSTDKLSRFEAVRSLNVSTKN